MHHCVIKYIDREPLPPMGPTPNLLIQELEDIRSKGYDTLVCVPGELNSIILAYKKDTEYEEAIKFLDHRQHFIDEHDFIHIDIERKISELNT
jgi:hypothetical protein